MIANNPQWMDEKLRRARARDAKRVDLESHAPERRAESPMSVIVCRVAKSSIAALFDLGLSDHEIVAYFHRFGDGIVGVANLRDQEVG
jgi:hypothetical protein